MSENRIHGASFPIAIIMLAVAIYLTVGIATMDVPATAGTPGPKFFPIIITIGSFIISAAIFVQSFRQWNRERQNVTLSDEEVGAIDRSNWVAAGIVIGSFVLFIALLQPVGWLISAALLFFGVAYGLGSKDLFINTVAGLMLSGIIQLVFSGLLGINLPVGILGGF